MHFNAVAIALALGSTTVSAAAMPQIPLRPATTTTLSSTTLSPGAQAQCVNNGGPCSPSGGPTCCAGNQCVSDPSFSTESMSGERYICSEVGLPEPAYRSSRPATASSSLTSTTQSQCIDNGGACHPKGVECCGGSGIRCVSDPRFTLGAHFICSEVGLPEAGYRS